MTSVLVIVGTVAVIMIAIGLFIARVDGSIYSSDFVIPKPERMTSSRQVRLFLEEHYRGKVQLRGRWAWHPHGAAFIRVLWLWWRVPVRWSMGAFNLLVMEQTVNGKDA